MGSGFELIGDQLQREAARHLGIPSLAIADLREFGVDLMCECER